MSLVYMRRPTLFTKDEIKVQFYDSLVQVTSSIPPREKIYILGDFNARVGADHNKWPMCLGMHDVGRINENGQILLEFCAQFQLCITSSFCQSTNDTRYPGKSLTRAIGINSINTKR